MATSRDTAINKMEFLKRLLLEAETREGDPRDLLDSVWTVSNRPYQKGLNTAHQLAPLQEVLRKTLVRANYRGHSLEWEFANGSRQTLHRSRLHITGTYDEELKLPTLSEGELIQGHEVEVRCLYFGEDGKAKQVSFWGPNAEEDREMFLDLICGVTRDPVILFPAR